MNEIIEVCKFEAKCRFPKWTIGKFDLYRQTQTWCQLSSTENMNLSWVLRKNKMFTNNPFDYVDVINFKIFRIDNHLRVWLMSYFWINLKTLKYICFNKKDQLFQQDSHSLVLSVFQIFYSTHVYKYLSALASLVIAINPSMTSNEFGTICFGGKRNPYQPIDVWFSFRKMKWISWYCGFWMQNTKITFVPEFECVGEGNVLRSIDPINAAARGQIWVKWIEMIRH